MATPFGTPGADFLFGTPGTDNFSGGAGNDQYTMNGGGRDIITDEAGTDTIVLAQVSADAAAVYVSGNDLLLRYPGGELRLIGQAGAGDAIESITFGGDNTVWNRAELDAHAATLPDSQAGPLGVQVALAGQAFSYAIDQDLFAHEYTLGATSIEVTGLQGGALPGWLTFDAEQVKFSGTPAEADAGVTGVLVALRDESGAVAVAPLVISVEGETNVAPDDNDAAPAPPPAGSPANTDEPAPSLLPATLAGFDAVPLLVQPGYQPAAEGSVQVGAIEDPIYWSIERLLFAPATSHAPAFLERYAEAVQEFRSRHPAPDELPPEPLPTDEEMASYNTALHEWLDAEDRRLSALAGDETWDFGGMHANYFNAGGGIDRLIGGTSEAFARPGLPALPAIQAQPGLKEGLAALSG
jgi:Ca2+-binding RTX toxin-like protein